MTIREPQEAEDLLIRGFPVFVAAFSRKPAFDKPAQLATHLKTIAIPLFDDQSGFGEAGLREEITNKLIERFQADNSLEVSDSRNADSILEGIIVSVRDEPSVVEPGETVDCLQRGEAGAVMKIERQRNQRDCDAGQGQPLRRALQRVPPREPAECQRNQPQKISSR